jgi:hypothetical protein
MFDAQGMPPYSYLTTFFRVSIPLTSISRSPNLFLS